MRLLTDRPAARLPNTPSKSSAQAAPRVRWPVGYAAISRMCLLCTVVGCSAAPPPTIAPELRQTVKNGLLEIGAKVTATDDETTYLSMRNTHVELRELSLKIEGSRRTQKDFRDFLSVGGATAQRLLGTAEYEQFQRWFQEALASRGTATVRGEYEKFKVTLSRQHLLLFFTANALEE